MIRLLQGDCIEQLRTLPADSVQACVTSPPYWGLRDYGVAGQIGLEPTLQEWVDKMVDVFREVRRVLRPDGLLWLNLGDAYAGSWGAQGRQGESGQMADRAVAKARERSSIRAAQIAAHPHMQSGTGSMSRTPGLKPKDLIGQPWRVAFALQQPYYTGRIKSELDRVWLAAIIDGEGCFFIHKRKAGTPSYSKFTRSDGSEANYTRTADTFGVGLEICNTSKAIIDRVQAIAGGGTVTTQSPQQNARRKQTIYRWRVAPNEAKRIAQEVYPHLVGKQHQARLLFNCPSTGEAGAAAHQAMMDLHNGVETAVDYPAPPSLFEPGWYLRQDVIWSKPNAMPESVRDRCTKAHEYVFLLSKSERYFYAADAVSEPASPESDARYDRGRSDTHKWADGGPGNQSIAKSFDGMRSKRDSFKREDSKRAAVIPGQSVGTHRPDREESTWDTSRRNRRSVWTITTEPYREAHFATFPSELPSICILASTRPGDTVLDPFNGSGTTGAVALSLGRSYIGIELNREYIALTERRLSRTTIGLPLEAQVADLTARMEGR